MLFNSLEFILFLPVVFFTYFALPHKYRWILLLVASYFFYMCWEVGYILLIVSATVVSYFGALGIERAKTKRGKNLYLWSSIGFALLLLFFFKYYNFFRENFEFIASWVDLKVYFPTLKVLLPVGISFYTFQVISYLADVYYGTKTAERHFGIYALYVSFFPQLVAGPIERSQSLLPQFFEKKTFDYDRIRSGLLLVVWGFVKKVAIADRLGLMVNGVYNDIEQFDGLFFVLATLGFVFQVYCDFSGYSDIAIGCARMLGFDLMKNFDFPYISQSFSELYRRWHISLSTWIRDYLYNPLVIMTRSWMKWGLVVSLVITFTVMGFWHGSAWTFIVFGFLNGLVLSYEALSRKKRKKWSKKYPKWLYGTASMMLTFSAWCFFCIFFRANSMTEAMYILDEIFLGIWNDFNMASIAAKLDYLQIDRYYLLTAVAAVFCLELVQYLHRNYNLYDWLLSRPRPIRWGLYSVLFFVIVFLGVFKNVEFIYFAF